MITSSRVSLPDAEIGSTPKRPTSEKPRRANDEFDRILKELNFDEGKAVPKVIEDRKTERIIELENLV